MTFALSSHLDLGLKSYIAANLSLSSQLVLEQQRQWWRRRFLDLVMCTVLVPHYPGDGPPSLVISSCNLSSLPGSFAVLYLQHHTFHVPQKMMMLLLNLLLRRLNHTCLKNGRIFQGRKFIRMLRITSSTAGWSIK